MMKIIVLLASVALWVSSAPIEYTERQLLTTVFDKLVSFLKDTPDDVMGIFLKDLKVKGHRACTREFFVRAEKQLVNKVSGRSGAHFETFRTDKPLIRSLHMFNDKHHGTPVTSQDEIQLKEFLEDLKQCLRAEISKQKG